MNVVGADRDVPRQLFLDADARLTRVRQMPVRVVEVHGAGVLRRGAGRDTCWFTSARLTTGPLTRNGLVGRRPADGPGSTLFVDGQIGAGAGAAEIAVNEFETRRPRRAA